MAVDRMLVNSAERTRQFRDSIVYPQLFGCTAELRLPLSQGVFDEHFPAAQPRQQWFAHEVLLFAPTKARSSWLYVTSGLSDDDLDDGFQRGQAAGLGCELLLETTAESPWAVALMQIVLARQLLSGFGLLGGEHLWGDFDRFRPFPTTMADGQPLSQAAWLMLTAPPHLPHEAATQSGHFDLFQLVALTDADERQARWHGAPALLAELESRPGFPAIAIGEPQPRA